MIWKILGSFGGAGYFPIAPGTLTSAVVALFIFIFLETTSISYIIITLCVLFIGFFICDKAGKAFGGDDNRIVIDEVAGIFFSYIFIEKHWILFVAGFILFRFFDIIKPPPIKNLEKIRGGWGIMLDDIMAGAYTNIVLAIIFYIWQGF